MTLRVLSLLLSADQRYGKGIVKKHLYKSSRVTWYRPDLIGWAGEKRRSDRPLVPRPRRRRIQIRQITSSTRLYLSPLRKRNPVGWAVGKGRSGRTLAPRARRRRFRMRQITRLYLSSLRRKTAASGFPLSHPLHSWRRLANMRQNSTKTEWCTMLVMQHRPK